MNVTPIELLPLEGADNASKADKATISIGADFSAWMDKNITETNDKLVHAERMVQKLVLGEADNLHQVMIALDGAKLSFQLMVQVRNKLLEAYQDVLRMQI